MKCAFAEHERIYCDGGEVVDFYLIYNPKKIIGFCEKHRLKREPDPLQCLKISKEEAVCYEVLDDL
jgi:hypothetical protein